METNYEIVIESIKKEIIKEYGKYMTAEGMEKLLEKATIHYNAIMTMQDESKRNDRIVIIIKPEKFDPEMFMQIEDTWNEYIVNELKLEPCDAIMVTPF